LVLGFVCNYSLIHIFRFFAGALPELGGIIGFEMNLFAQDYIGKTGTFLVLLFGIITYLLFKIKISPEAIKSFLKKETRNS